MANHNNAQSYQPQNIDTPPLYSWPPRPLAALRYLLIDMLYPWTFVYLGLGFITWEFLTPDMETMAVLQPGWIALLWLRNCALLMLFAGGLHWYLYIRQSQGQQLKFEKQWLASNSKKFLWNNQVKDNMFWSIVSGVTFWTAYEAITYWFYASGRLEVPDSPGWFIAAIYVLIFWSTANFYTVHRFLHWKPVYRHVHELHHRNINVGPWSGISMHPVEHLLYFTPFILWWFVPVHPVIIIITGFYQALNPSLSHSGFDYVMIGDKWKLKTGDWFHQLHHRYFELNYGNTPAPLDKVFGSWHDGSAESMQLRKEKLQRRVKQR